MKKAEVKNEKEKLKKAMLGVAQEKESKLFEKVKFDLMSESSMSSIATTPKLDKQAEGYEKLLIKLEGDVR
jgi:hypothetical protein